MKLTLPEVKVAIQELREAFKEAPTDKDERLEFRDGLQKEFNKTIKNIRESYVFEATEGKSE